MECLAQSPAHSQHSLFAFYHYCLPTVMMITLIYVYSVSRECLMVTSSAGSTSRVSVHDFISLVASGDWLKVSHSLGSLPILLSLSLHAGLLAGPASMQTLTLSCNQEIKNKLGFESKAIGAFDLGYKARQLLDTKALIYL